MLFTKLTLNGDSFNKAHIYTRTLRNSFSFGNTEKKRKSLLHYATAYSFSKVTASLVLCVEYFFGIIWRCDMTKALSVLAPRLALVPKIFPINVKCNKKFFLEAFSYYFIHSWTSNTYVAYQQLLPFCG